MAVNKLSLPAKENAVQLKINEIIDNLGGGGTATDVQINGTSITSNNVANIVTNTVYNASSNKIATMADVPSVDSALSSTSTNPVQNKFITTALNNKQGTISDLSTIRSGASAGATAVQPDDLATVATSGNYNDLTNKPTIPTVNNATLTIQKNGTTVKTFTANASSNVTANITVPTKTSELTNDSGYTSNVGTVTKVNNTSPDANGNVSISIPTVPLEGVQINGSDLTITNKKVNIPLSGTDTLGVAKANAAYGVYNNNGNLTISRATDTQVTQKTSLYRPLTPSNIDLAVKLGVTTNGIPLTDAEKVHAKDWLGISESGGITDVIVNDTSVVSGGVANIDLTGYVQKSGGIFSGNIYAPQVLQESMLTPNTYIQCLTPETVNNYSAKTDLSNLSSTSSTNFDGQIIFKYVELLNGTPSAMDTSTNLKTTGYLPNDNYKYEVFVKAELRTKTTAVEGGVGNYPSPWNGQLTGFAKAFRVGEYSRFDYHNGWLPLNDDGIIYYQTTAKPNIGIIIALLGYRRTGTNS